MYARHTAAFLLSSALLVCALPLTAAAQTQRVEVQTSDLNLASDTGRILLQQRIARAADTVCGAYEGLTTSKAPAYEVCLKAARAGATAQADAMIAATGNGQKIAASH